jgi:hypothetical protein
MCSGWDDFTNSEKATIPLVMSAVVRVISAFTWVAFLKLGSIDLCCDINLGVLCSIYYLDGSSSIIILGGSYKSL